MKDLLLFISLYIVLLGVASLLYLFFTKRGLKQKEKDFLLFSAMLLITAWFGNIIFIYTLLIIELFYISIVISVFATYIYLIAVVYMLGGMITILGTYFTHNSESYLQAIIDTKLL